MFRSNLDSQLVKNFCFTDYVEILWTRLNLVLIQYFDSLEDLMMTQQEVKDLAIANTFKKLIWSLGM